MCSHVCLWYYLFLLIKSSITKSYFGKTWGHNGCKMAFGKYPKSWPCKMFQQIITQQMKFKIILNIFMGNINCI